ncbi:hypothetical protein LTR91_023590 [Friedmanniomyces endolithicus]|uniref:Uncharacterized protein n=1 Tax=Friedmanniomyces endolithicus TaxID=329885 RepID=A0AAN6H3S8_9PEZI|nr:hypothetical protein LTR94_004588 [Friedmanniomyces endolithicus]KAK0789329.1 hypothetical protein LTR38_010981 [Friedmanniomyces endolithicus]KAK0793409.1 hypothetical protein LTR75_011144 [Friedmanniomyces endolithicus]KAK0800091.1 hypothetical protein LTR59_005888 [Friedmanniomyces endolithicus]KAK0842675.1 hypothetical protein LTR03_009155 [Friedmanniomyces endolithicus]
MQALGASRPPFIRAEIEEATKVREDPLVEEEFNWIDMHRALQGADGLGMLGAIEESQGDAGAGAPSIAGVDVGTAPVADRDASEASADAGASSSQRDPWHVAVKEWIDDIPEESSTAEGRYSYGSYDPPLNGGLNGHLWRQEAMSRQAERLAMERQGRRDLYRRGG